MIRREISSFEGTGVASGMEGAAALNCIIKSMVADCVLPVFTKWGRADLVKLSLALRADPGLADACGIPPLTYASALHGNASSEVNLLLTARADPRFQDAAGDVVRMFDPDAATREVAMAAVRQLNEQLRELYAGALHNASMEHASTLARK